MRSTLGKYQAKFPAPFALVGVRIESGLVTGMEFLPKVGNALAPQSPLAERVWAQIERYLVDPEFRFDLPVAGGGTPFQRGVWRKIAEIRAGRTRSYGEIARELLSSPRAVGQACGANPVPLIVPCHRVLAAGGIGGFAHREAGFQVAAKRWLLAHERASFTR